MPRRSVLLLTLLMGSGVVLNMTHAETEGAVPYNQYCAACHGADGEGDARWPQLNDAGDMPAPPHNNLGHTWRHSTEELITVTLNGRRDPYNTTDILTMPAYKGILTEQQIETIIQYVKHWWTSDQIEKQKRLDDISANKP